MIPCNFCKGKGKVTVQRGYHEKDKRTQTFNCGKCEGLGEVDV